MTKLLSPRVAGVSLGLLMAGLLLGAEPAASAAWRLHATRAAQVLGEAERQVTRWQADESQAEELQFREFFSPVPSDRGLDLSARLRNLDGRRVRIRGYMTREQQRSPGMFLLTPMPTQISNDGYCLIDDLPPATLPVLLPASHANLRTPYRPGVLELTGVLVVGHAVTPDGRNAFARLILDEAPVLQPQDGRQP